MMSRFYMYVTLILCTLALPLAVPAQTLQFAGYTWKVKSGSGMGPGPNQWSAANAWVDKSGALHLRINKQGGKWYCAEVETTQRLGFGTYQFQVTGRIDRFDKNIVLGLFKYPTPDVGPDGTNEIDIEFARWAIPTAPNGNDTVYPPVKGPPQTSHTYNFKLTGNDSTHRFIWKSDSVFYQSLYGHRDDDANLFDQWRFQPASPMTQVPQQPSPLNMNLWLFRGNAPTDGKPVEVVIRHFSYKPL